MIQSSYIVQTSLSFISRTVSFFQTGILDPFMVDFKKQMTIGLWGPEDWKLLVLMQSWVMVIGSSHLDWPSPHLLMCLEHQGSKTQGSSVWLLSG